MLFCISNPNWQKWFLEIKGLALLLAHTVKVSMLGKEHVNKNSWGVAAVMLPEIEKGIIWAHILPLSHKILILSFSEYNCLFSHFKNVFTSTL